MQYLLRALIGKTGRNWNPGMPERGRYYRFRYYPVVVSKSIVSSYRIFSWRKGYNLLGMLSIYSIILKHYFFVFRVSFGTLFLIFISTVLRLKETDTTEMFKAFLFVAKTIAIIRLASFSSINSSNRFQIPSLSYCSFYRRQNCFLFCVTVIWQWLVTVTLFDYCFCHIL